MLQFGSWAQHHRFSARIVPTARNGIQLTTCGSLTLHGPLDTSQNRYLFEPLQMVLGAERAAGGAGAGVGGGGRGRAGRGGRGRAASHQLHAHLQTTRTDHGLPTFQKKTKRALTSTARLPSIVFSASCTPAAVSDAPRVAFGTWPSASGRPRRGPGQLASCI